MLATPSVTTRGSPGGRCVFILSPVSSVFQCGRGCVWAGASVTVINEVVVAGLLGDGRGRVGDLNVLQVEEAQLDFHAEQGVQVVPRQVAHHVLSQQRVQPVCPDTVLAGEGVTVKTVGDNCQSITTIADAYWPPSVCRAGGYERHLHHHYIHSISVKSTLLLWPLFYGEGAEVRGSSIAW